MNPLVIGFLVSLAITLVAGLVELFKPRWALPTLWVLGILWIAGVLLVAAR